MRVFRETQCGKTKKDGHEHTAACYGGPWYMDYIDDEGIRHREVGGYTKRDAQRALAKTKEDLRLGKYVKRHGQKKFEELAKEYMDYSKANKRSWERDVYSLHHLVPFFKDKSLSEIKPHSIEKYKAERKKAVSESTINRELACLKHMFSMAMKWEWTADNPVKKVKLFKEHLLPMRILSFEEEKKLLSVCNGSLRPIIITAVETGMRKGEILNLKWSRVNLEERNIRVEDTKNGEFRIIPVSSVLLGVLEELERDGDYVFSKNGGAAIRSIKTGFCAAIKRAGIQHIRFHDLRHTFASREVMSGVDLATVKELMGHKTITMTMRYSHPTPEHKRLAVEMLRSPLNGSEKGSKTDSFETQKESRVSEVMELATIN
jgi:integrase